MSFFALTARSAGNFIALAMLALVIGMISQAAVAQSAETTLRVGLVGQQEVAGKCLVYIRIENTSDDTLEDVKWFLSPANETGQTNRFFSLEATGMVPARASTRQMSIGDAPCETTHLQVNYADVCTWTNGDKSLDACVLEMDAYSLVDGMSFGWTSGGS